MVDIFETKFQINHVKTKINTVCDIISLMPKIKQKTTFTQNFIYRL